MRQALWLLLPAVLGGLGGYWGYRMLQPAAPVEVAPAIKPPSSTDAAPGLEDSRRIVEVVPDVELTDRSGARRSVRSYKHRAIAYNFWATWCTPCRREIPLLNQLRRDHQAMDFEVVGIAVDRAEAIEMFAKETAIEYPLLWGEQDGLDALDAFGVPSAFPVTVFADSHQRIVTVKLGELHADEAGFILASIAAVNDQKLDLVTARQQIAAKMRELASNRARANSNKSSDAAQQRDRD
jgi:thiol-disulfide isomerase/thioredoxin